MSSPYAHLLNDDQRARRVITSDPISGTVIPGGFLLGEWRCNSGDYHDVVFPPGYGGGQAAIPHYASGGSEIVSETDGVRWMQDRDHPIGALMNADGSLSNDVYLHRTEGRSRIFFFDNTYKVCVNAVNAFGMRTNEQLGYSYEYGSKTIPIPKGGIFVLIDGSGSRVHIVHAESGDCAYDLNAGHYGVMVWKLPNG